MWSVLAPWLACRPAAVERPNLALIVVDTLRADHLRTYGYAREVGLEVDAWARGAAVFEDATSHSPWTKPSVATLLTSLEPKDHGVVDWDRRLNRDFVTLQSALGAAGYDTLAVVAHLAFDPDSNEFHHGWDQFDVSVWKGVGSPHLIATSDKVTDRALAGVEQSRGPWLLMAHYFDPHETYLERPKYPFGAREVDLYDAEVAATDAAIGRLLDGLPTNTVVALVADHGEEFGEHGGRAHTVTLYDEVLRVPWIVAGPGIQPQRVPGRVGLVDLAPTLLERLGQPIPPPFKGRPVPFSDGRFTVEPRPVFSETQRVKNRRSVVDGDYKAILDLNTGTVELYNVAHDPGEAADVASLRPKVVGRLEAELRARETDRWVVPSDVLGADEKELLEAMGYAMEPDQNSQQ